MILYRWNRLLRNFEVSEIPIFALCRQKPTRTYIYIYKLKMFLSVYFIISTPCASRKILPAAAGSWTRDLIYYIYTTINSQVNLIRLFLVDINRFEQGFAVPCQHVIVLFSCNNINKIVDSTGCLQHNIVQIQSYSWRTQTNGVIFTPILFYPFFTHNSPLPPTNLYFWCNFYSFLNYPCKHYPFTFYPF
jgi:hypothetical protein